MEPRIPIQNLYYLLCYAWGLPEQREWVKVDADTCPAVLDLLSRLLTKGADVLLKRGIAKEYRSHEEEIAGIKGKLELAQTLKQGRYRECKTICTIDDLTGNILLNQIVYTTMYRLLGNKDLNKDVKKDLLRSFRRFPTVTIIDLFPGIFKDVRLNRNNRFYHLIISVCEMLYANMLPDKQRPGEYRFIDFTRDEDVMNNIFESFLRNFYHQECSTEYPVVRRTRISFHFDAVNAEDVELLPIMETDVTLDNPKEGKRIIIDAKYYQEMFVSRFGVNKNLRTDHIRQIESYIKNQEDTSVPYTMATKGIMVYPKTNVDAAKIDYISGGHILRFCTVDLGQDWHQIDQRLRQIIQF